MTFLTKWFPVGLIPKQLLVTPVRDDMIHHRRGDNFALCQTEGT